MKTYRHTVAIHWGDTDLQGEKVTRTCVGATPHRKGVDVEIDCVASYE